MGFHLGLSCACAIEKTFPKEKYSRIFVIAGPGSMYYLRRQFLLHDEENTF
jgi:hypothetical protein